MHAHAAEWTSLEGEIERRIRDRPRIEGRGIVADPESQLAPAAGDVDLDPARTPSIPVLDHVADELVHRLDEVGHRRFIAAGRCDLLPDEGPHPCQLAQRCLDHERGRAS
jgi:hypothetical protein